MKEEGSAPSMDRVRLTGWAERVALALVAFVPQLWSQPGVVASDTKSYLYIDPARFLAQSATLWNPDVGLGTVTFQQTGYLFPMGPFFWIVHELGIPMWVGERLWVGAILFGAGTGVLFLCRTLGLSGPGRVVAAFAYMLSPYFLQYVGRISVILLPWAGLGWLLACTIRATREGGWRYPAVFALVWLTVSGINASSVIYVAVAPALWLLYAVFVSRQHTIREAWAATWRTVVLTFGVSLWWLEALLIAGRYGLNYLPYTESVSQVATSSLASEVARGLGYWYYYGADLLGQWAPTSVAFTQQLPLIVLSFGVPVLGIVSAVVVRWRERTFFVVLVILGFVLAVGTHPYTAPSLAGAILKAVMTKTNVGLALRSTDRATPLVILGFAMLLGAGVTALARRTRPVGVATAVVVLAIIAAANPPVWNGTTVDDHYTQPSPLPSYVLDTAKALDAEHTDTRVMAVPGQNFAAYRWGDTVDPVWPGILKRPFVTREQLPWGSLPGYDLLAAFDNEFQDGTVNTSSIAPLARLMDVGDVLVQNDLDYERYNQPQPKQLWQLLQPSPPGLGPARGFGKPRPNVATVKGLHEMSRASSPNAPWPSPIEVMSVSGPRALVRGESDSAAVVVDGDADGLAAAAGVGLLDTSSPIFYSATLDRSQQALRSVLSGTPTLVLTDTNRKAGFTWSAIQGQQGPTLSASHEPPTNPLDIFTHAPKSSQSTSRLVGVSKVTASPSDAEHQAYMAIDGDPDSAWEVTDPIGKYWEVTLTKPVTTDHITLSQPVSDLYTHQQWITRVTITFDHAHPVNVALGPSSRTKAGQTIDFPQRTFKVLSITIRGTNLSLASPAVLETSSAVGLSEVGIEGVKAQQVIDMPTDMLSNLGRSSEHDRLVVLMTRQRDVATPADADPEPVLARSFSLPTERSFKLSGSVTLSTLASDSVIDAVLGRPLAGAGVIAASSSSRLTDSPGDTASAALDGNSSTVWSPDYGAANQAGSWIKVELSKPVTFDRLDLKVVADGYHSVPTRIRVSTESGSVDVAVPTIKDQHRQGSVVSVPLQFAPLTGKDVTITFTGVRLEYTKMFYGNQPPLSSGDEVAQPIGIAELGIPGVEVGRLPADLPAACRSDLLSVDGRPVPLEVTGSTEAALQGKALQISPCGNQNQTLELGPGRHEVTSTLGALTGFDVDQVMLDSAPVRSSHGGASSAASTVSSSNAIDAAAAAKVRVVSETSTTIKLDVTPSAKRPFWLVFGQSLNSGWSATLGDGQVLGAPTLIDGFANGWLIDPTSKGAASPSELSVTLRWKPQGDEDLMLVLSVLATVVCLVLAFWRRRPQERDGKTASVAAEPDFDNPFSHVGGDIPMPTALAAAAGLGLAGVFVLPSAVGVTAALVGLVVLVALLMRRGRGATALAAIGCVTATAVFIVVAQALGHYQPTGWPSHFEVANDLMWLAIVFVGADVVVARVMVGHRRPSNQERNSGG